MNIHSFEWDKKNEIHIAEHGVEIFEVEEAILFCKPFYQKTKESKYIAYAATEDVRYLFIVFVIKQSTHIRVITARDMTDKEKRFYRKRKGGK